ncbi:MAG TPA: hypothetical protein PLU53_16145, partial [Bacteroidia bacterium]|nr:hypothetical protein [Bacteroidia bacterium]
NELYAGGSFTHSGATAINRVAKLSGGNWVEVAHGFNSNVNCLYVYADILYAGGPFSSSNSIAVNKIAKLQAGNWVNPNSTIVTGEVKAMTEHLGNLYIGGFPFGVMKLNGSTWTSIGSLNGQVYALGSFQLNNSTTKYLYVGGDFTVSPSFGICVSDGNSYSIPLNPYTSPSKVYAILTSWSKIFTGGEFTVSATWGAGQTRVSTNISQKGYNTPWDTLSATFSAGAKVFSLGTYGGRLVAGGTFSTINGISMTNIAIRSTTVGIDEISDNVTDYKFFPSPMSEQATLRITSKSPLGKPTLSIFDQQSRLISTVSSSLAEPNQTEFEIRRGNLATGLYYYVVSDENGMGILSDKFLIQ